ncbi:hypothetical protein D1814_05445 [Alteromonas sp. BL110]|uniref:Spy/CpxP family protein refolding chaperone n=1 Tax=Alteromonas sp. BL110 TaxID=1714845 RepID=UPI000E4F356B|nr:Spy/CpxP family protein refolding chaperone [Alteromonas sp. BL110]AXT38155.1 hypothetical protein D1814_05445 [Alteromonas sp. BL110]RKM80899.1 hypothetical protein D7031_18790 [Alteromonas sp. BL110]
MKKLLIASVTVAAIGLGGLALAQPAGSGMRHHDPVKEIVKHLRGISLSDAQREEIKTLVSAFKDANPRPEFGDIEKPNLDFATATEAQFSAFIQTQIEEREARHFAFAQLRHDIYNVLNEEQQETLLARDAKRELDKQKHHDAFVKQETRFAKRMNGEGKGPQRKRKPKDFLFEGIELSDEQIASLAELRESFKDTSKTNREMLRSFKDAQRDLVRSESFSQDAWNALTAQYKEDLVSAKVEKAKQRQAMFQILSPEQQAKLEALREEERKLRELFKL